MSRAFDRFMVDVEASANPKIKRFKRAGKEVRWAWFHGVLPIAARARMRGSFCIGIAPADEEDVAAVADVTVAEAAKALEVARHLGMLDRDEHGIEWVHDFEDYNPEPKVDKTSPERSRRYRERQRALRDANGSVTDASHRDGRDANGAITPPEVEGEVEGSSLRSDPPRGKRAASERKTVDQNSLPANFPSQLVDTANTVLHRLTAVWEERGGHEPTLRGVGLVLARFPDRDHLRVLAELEHWALAGRGAMQAVKDWPKTYGTFLERTPAGKPSLAVVPEQSERDRRRAADLQAITRLTGGPDAVA